MHSCHAFYSLFGVDIISRDFDMELEISKLENIEVK